MPRKAPKPRSAARRAPPPPPRDHVAEAARPVYLIAASVQHALTELLKAKNRAAREDALRRLEHEARYLKINVAMLRKEVERG